MELKEGEYLQLNTENQEKPPQEEPKTDKNEPIHYFQLFKYSSALDKFLLITATLICLGSGLIYSLFSIALGRALDGIVNYSYMLANSANESDLEAANTLFWNKMRMFMITGSSISFIVIGCTYLAIVIFNYTAIKQTFKIREMYLSKVLHQDISWHDQNKTSDFASRISDDLTKIQDGIGDKVVVFLFQFAIIAVGIIQAYVLGWQFALICSIALPVSSLMMGLVAKFSAKLSKEESEDYGEAGTVAEETLTYIKTVVAYDCQEVQAKQYDKLVRSAMKNNVRRFFFNGLGSGLTLFFLFVGNAFSLWYGARLVVKGRGIEGDYTVEKVVAIFSSIQLSQLYIPMTTPLMEVFGMAQGAAHKIFSVIESEIVINKFYTKGTRVNKIKGKITFEAVSFSYPARNEVDVLKKLNLSINPGETVALVGSSGCGKSTVIQLIQRFYDVNSGNIYIDDFNIKELNLVNLRNQIRVVSQEPILFDESVASNIRWGNLNATQNDIEEAAKKANAHLFITLLPNGYQTLIGERGTQLSGGQKQRIAIARALVGKPSILLFDEATSALDSNSESLVQSALDAASNVCTTVIVAHRLSTVQKANRIIVIDNGTVVEEGSHDELMANRGAYRGLVESQLLQTYDEKIAGPLEPEMENSVETFTSEEDKLTNEFGKSNQELNVSSKAVWLLVRLHMRNKMFMAIGILSSSLFGLCFLAFGIVYSFCVGVLAEINDEYLLSQTNIYCLYYLLIGVVIGIIAFSQAYMTGVAAEGFVMNLRSAMFRTILKQEMSWFDSSENGVGSLGAILASEAANIQGALGLRIGLIFNTVATSAFCAIFGLYLSWNLFLVSLSLFPLLMISTYVEQKILIRENLKQADTLQKSTKIAVEAISNIRTVASLTIEKLIHNQYMDKLKDYKRMATRNNHLRGIVFGTARGLYPLSFVITLYYGAHLMKTKEVDYMAVILISQLLVSSTWCVTTVMTFAPNYYKGYVAASQIYDLLNRESKMKVAPSKNTPDQIAGEIEYNQVSFCYPTRPEVEILKHFNLSALKGKTVALVGPSGCGKSTVIQLLERFYDTTSGAITFGNQDITEMELSSLRMRLGIVMQEPHLFGTTIGENIAYGVSSRQVSTKDIIEAAQIANIHNFIVSLPLGYDTVLGDKGTQLSGGQKQRIAIARSLIRNPEVLLLDEATSALDAESEKAVQEALNKAREDRTCIVIAHRLKTVVDSDVIAVICENKIAEQGTHQELMEKKGLYWDLYNAQN